MAVGECDHAPSRVFATDENGVISSVQDQEIRVLTAEDACDGDGGGGSLAIAGAGGDAEVFVTVNGGGERHNLGGDR